ncbi:MAG: hypothetical protein ABI806_25125 [Candidatus Solibacter sp.]
MMIRMLGAIAISCFYVSAQPQPSNELTIFYTGKLLGYARTPDIQRVDQWGWLVKGEAKQASPEVAKLCADPAADCQRLYVNAPGSVTSPVAAALTDQINDQRKALKERPNLLLGMGDSFAMDYFSRVVVAKMYEGHEEYIGKDELFFYQDHRSADKGDRWVDLRTLRAGPSFKVIQEEEYSARTEVPGDNVAQFFIDTNYDALVPGKHDFYYGPERLRQLARLMAEKSRTQMLAANLIIQTKPAVSPVQVNEQLRAKKRNFETAVGEMKWSMPKTVLPWLRTFTLKNYKDGSGNDLVDINAPAQLCETNDRDQKPDPCWSLPRRKPQEGAAESKTELLYEFGKDRKKEPIPSERTYLLCVKLRSPKKPDEKPDLCQAVDVSTPFFQYPDVVASKNIPSSKGTSVTALYSGNKLVKRDYIPSNIKVDRWVVKNNTVVMGVVEPGIEVLVGSLNTVYANKDPANETFVTAMDPGEALKQLLEFCEADGACSDSVPMVLMAQMPRDEAAILNDRMDRRFKIVLAQADNRFPTAAEKVEYDPGHRPIVLVPHEVMDNDKEGQFKRAQLNSAWLTGLQTPTPKAPNIAVTTVATKRVDIRETGLSKEDCLCGPVISAWTLATREPASNDGDDASRFRTVVLHAIRDTLKSDVALIQDRDFYDLAARMTLCQKTPIETPRARIQAYIEQILWKGDFAISRTITGAALKAVLKESERLKSIEENSYRPEKETHRWLVHLGLWKDPEAGTWYVNGGAIDDKATYSVAITDFLGSGDTGYPDLKEPAVPPGTRPRDMGTLLRISEAVLDKLSPPVKDKLSRQPAAPAVNAYTYLDQSDHTPFPPPGKAGFLNQTVAIFLGLFTMHPKLDSSAVRLGQSRPYWRLMVDKGEAGYNDYRHNMTTQDQLNAQFAGTTQSGVLARKTTAWPIAFQFEARRELSGYHFFSRTELDFKSTRIQQDGAAGRFLTTYPTNKITIETGYRTTFGGTMRSRPWSGLLLSAYGESNPRKPVADGYKATVTGCTPTVKVPDDGSAPVTTPCPSTISYAPQLPRTHRLLAKTGFRRENEQNWLEAGFFGGVVFRPTDFSLLQGDTLISGLNGAGACRIADLVDKDKPTKLSDCLEKRFAVTVPTPGDADTISPTLGMRVKSGSKPESGVFLNFNFRVAAPKNWVVKDFYLEQRGSWFFNHSGDSVLDARMIETISFGPTLTVIPSLPGLSLKPTYTIFFYRNKVVHNLLEGRTMDIKLDYRFDWKTGASWRQVLRYGRPK